MDIGRLRTAALLLIATSIAFVLVAGLAGCGGNSPGVPSITTVSGASGSAGSTGTAATQKTDEEKVRAFVQAMRDKGIPLLDPEVEPDGTMLRPHMQEGTNVSQADYEAAWAQCAYLLEGFSFGYSEEKWTALTDRYVALAKLLRDKGFDVDDPKPATLKDWAIDLSQKIDWDNPAAAAAYREWGGEAGDILHLPEITPPTPVEGSGAKGKK